MLITTLICYFIETSFILFCTLIHKYLSLSLPLLLWYLLNVEHIKGKFSSLSLLLWLKNWFSTIALFPLWLHICTDSCMMIRYCDKDLISRTLIFFLHTAESLHFPIIWWRTTKELFCTAQNFQWTEYFFYGLYPPRFFLSFDPPSFRYYVA